MSIVGDYIARGLQCEGTTDIFRNLQSGYTSLKLQNKIKAIVIIVFNGLKHSQ